MLCSVIKQRSTLQTHLTSTFFAFISSAVNAVCSVVTVLSVEETESPCFQRLNSSNNNYYEIVCFNTEQSNLEPASKIPKVLGHGLASCDSDI